MNHLSWNLIRVVKITVFSEKKSNIELWSNFSKIFKEIGNSNIGW